ncbi:hypothetical protein [Actinocatenispora rupis]|uniref:Uncharacterized protein n=1 Tax=Actinocatenispora rupis TaxID=519421 RepID=A0A8J3JBF8_9ACTN|nr:hypothetical protein [Actinocatenispora rupis]GID12928.1 hypothetical protein Aru02nite_38170 [Actinocatenispora rupis]
MDDRRRDRGAAVAAAVGRWIRPTVRDLALADYAAVALDAVNSPEIRVAATELLDDPRPAELLYRSCVDNAERILTGAGITSVGVNWRGRPIPLDRDPVQVVLAQTGAALVTMLAVASAAVLVVLRAPVSVPGLVTVPAVVLAVVVALAVRARVVRLLTRLGRADGTRWRTRVREEAVLPYLREYLNRRATDGQVLALRHVPGLGAADGMSRVVDRRVIDTTRELVNDLDSGAIAVAGSRGAARRRCCGCSAPPSTRARGRRICGCWCPRRSTTTRGTS